MSFWRSLFGRACVSMLAMAALGVAAIGALALAGAAWRPLDAVNHLTPFWALSAGLIALACGIWVQGRWRIACFAACGIALTVFAPHVLAEWGAAALAPAVTPASPPAPRVRVTALNMWHVAHYPAKMRTYLADSDADILILTEAPRTAGAELSRVRERFPYEVPCVTMAWCGVTILSRRPPIAVNAWAPAAARRAGRGPVRWVDATFLVDPARPKGGQFTIIGVHLLRRRFPETPAAELEALAAALHADPRPGVILAGDMNTTPYTHTLRRFERMSGLPRLSRAVGTWPTTARPWRQPRPPMVIAIDHVFASDEWGPAQMARGPHVGSDHYPVEASLVWRAPVSAP